MLASCGTEHTATVEIIPTNTTTKDWSLTKEDSLLMVRILVNRPSYEAYEKADSLAHASDDKLRGFIAGKSTDLLEGIDMEEDIYVHKLEQGQVNIYPSSPYQIKGINVEAWWGKLEEQSKIVVYSDHSLVIYLNLEAIEKEYHETVGIAVSKERFLWDILIQEISKIKNHETIRFLRWVLSYLIKCYPILCIG